MVVKGFSDSCQARANDVLSFSKKFYTAKNTIDPVENNRLMIVLPHPRFKIEMWNTIKPLKWKSLIRYKERNLTVSVLILSITRCHGNCCIW